MEDGDSDTDKYPHRTGHNAGYNELHGTWTYLLLTKRAGGKISFGSFLSPRHRLRLHTNPLTAPCEHIAKK